MINSPEPRTTRILIVDDERANRALLEVILQAEGFELGSAQNGEEALAMVAAQAPDLILLDVMMPGMTGYRVAQILKANPATKHIPLIMVTALDDRDARILGLNAGAEDFLSRPVDRAELCVRVRNLLRLKASSDDAIAQRDGSMGIVSHELRNALNGIVLTTTMLAEDAAGSVEGRAMLPGLQRVQSLAASMDRLIGDLVDVVSIEAGKMAMQLESRDVVALLTESVAAFSQAAADKGIAISSVTDTPSSLVARLDRVRTVQVLTNLITNALKFTERGGDITLRAHRVSDDVQVSVTDTGVGIPASMLEAVFERFLQVGVPDRRGLGLGLYISKSLVESQGGRMWARSEVGRGSTFCFTLPVALSEPGLGRPDDQ